MLRAFVAAWAACAIASANASVAEDKRARLSQLAVGAGGLIALNDDLFADLIAGTPREYHSFVMLTTRDPRCTVCNLFLEDVSLVARSYASAKVRDYQGSLPDVFFGVAYDKNIPLAIRKLKLQSLPQLYHYGPALTDPDGDGGFLARTEMRLPRGPPNVDLLTAFVRQRSGATFALEKSKLGPLLFLLGAVCALIFAVRSLINNMDFCLKIVRNRTLWMTVTVAFYVVSVSGGVFDIIRSPPPFSVRGKEVTLIHPQSNQQFVIEGAIVGTLNLLAGFSVVVLHAAGRRTSSSRAPSEGGGSGGGWKGPAMLGASACFAACFYSVLALYTYKNKWYRPWAL